MWDLASRARSSRSNRLRLRVQPIVNVFAHKILGQAVALLDLAFQLIAAAVDLGEIVVGPLTPLLLDLALPLPFSSFQFLSVPFDAVPVHCRLQNNS